MAHSGPSGCCCSRKAETPSRDGNNTQGEEGRLSVDRSFPNHFSLCGSVWNLAKKVEVPPPRLPLSVSTQKKTTAPQAEGTLGARVEATSSAHFVVPLSLTPSEGIFLCWWGAGVVVLGPNKGGTALPCTFFRKAATHVRPALSATDTEGLQLSVV